MLRMPGVATDAIDLTSLPAEVAALIERLRQQAQADAQELARREREIALARVKIDKLNFELARLKRWKFDAKTETMTAAQRLLFADTLAEDEASLQAKLAELQRGLPETPKTPKAPPRRSTTPSIPPFGVSIRLRVRSNFATACGMSRCLAVSPANRRSPDSLLCHANMVWKIGA